MDKPPQKPNQKHPQNLSQTQAQNSVPNSSQNNIHKPLQKLHQKYQQNTAQNSCEVTEERKTEITFAGNFHDRVNENIKNKGSVLQLKVVNNGKNIDINSRNVGSGNNDIRGLFTPKKQDILHSTYIPNTSNLPNTENREYMNNGPNISNNNSYVSNNPSYGQTTGSYIPNMGSCLPVNKFNLSNIQNPNINSGQHNISSNNMAQNNNPYLIKSRTNDDYTDKKQTYVLLPKTMYTIHFAISTAKAPSDMKIHNTNRTTHDLKRELVEIGNVNTYKIKRGEAFVTITHVQHDNIRDHVDRDTNLIKSDTDNETTKTTTCDTKLDGSKDINSDNKYDINNLNTSTNNYKYSTSITNDLRARDDKISVENPIIDPLRIVIFGIRFFASIVVPICLFVRKADIQKSLNKISSQTGALICLNVSHEVRIFLCGRLESIKNSKRQVITLIEEMRDHDTFVFNGYLSSGSLVRLGFSLFFISKIDCTEVVLSGRKVWLHSMRDSIKETSPGYESITVDSMKLASLMCYSRVKLEDILCENDCYLRTEGYERSYENIKKNHTDFDECIRSKQATITTKDHYGEMEPNIENKIDKDYLRKFNLENEFVRNYNDKERRNTTEMNVNDDYLGINNIGMDYLRNTKSVKKIDDLENGYSGEISKTRNSKNDLDSVTEDREHLERPDDMKTDVYSETCKRSNHDESELKSCYKVFGRMNLDDIDDCYGKSYSDKLNKTIYSSNNSSECRRSEYDNQKSSTNDSYDTNNKKTDDTKNSEYGVNNINNRNVRHVNNVNIPSNSNCIKNFNSTHCDPKYNSSTDSANNITKISILGFTEANIRKCVKKIKELFHDVLKISYTGTVASNSYEIFTFVNTETHKNIATGMRSEIKKLLDNNAVTFEIEMDIDHELEDFLCGKKNGKINKICKDNDCEVTINTKIESYYRDTSYKESTYKESSYKEPTYRESNYRDFNREQNHNDKLISEKLMAVYLTGSGANLYNTLTLLENEFPAELCFFLAEKHHRRIIGYGGKTIQKIMKKHGVYIKFMGNEEKNMLGYGGNVVVKTPRRNYTALARMREEVLVLADEPSREKDVKMCGIDLFNFYDLYGSCNISYYNGSFNPGNNSQNHNTSLYSHNHTYFSTANLGSLTIYFEHAIINEDWNFPVKVYIIPDNMISMHKNNQGNTNAGNGNNNKATNISDKLIRINNINENTNPNKLHLNDIIIKPAKSKLTFLKTFSHYDYEMVESKDWVEREPKISFKLFDSVLLYSYEPILKVDSKESVNYKVDFSERFAKHLAYTDEYAVGNRRKDDEKQGK